MKNINIEESVKDFNAGKRAGRVESDDIQKAHRTIKAFLNYHGLEYDTKILAVLGIESCINYVKQGLVDDCEVVDGQIVCKGKVLTIDDIKKQVDTPNNTIEKLGGIGIYKTHNIACGRLVHFIVKKGSKADNAGNTYLMSEKLGWLWRVYKSNKFPTMPPAYHTVEIDNHIVAVTVSEFKALGIEETPIKWYQ